MGLKVVHVLELDLDRGQGRRAPTDHVLLDPGTYLLEQSTGSGGYTPFSTSSIGQSPHWFHEVHLAIVPIGSREHTARHLVLRNREAPGPHPDMESARDAFRALTDAERSFVIGERSSVAIWLAAGEYGDWEPGRYAYGRMWLKLCRVAS